MNDMQSRLAEMMKANVGDPPGRVTVQAVRRLRSKRHVRVAGLVTVVAVIAAVSVSAGFRLTTVGPASGSAAPPEGVPRYYAEEGNGSGHPYAVIRATSTGAVTAGFHCPLPYRKSTNIIYPVAADAHRDFFMVCQTFKDQSAGDAKVYRFHVTTSGKVVGYAWVPGGYLGAVRVSRMVVSPDGSQVAVLDSPASSRAYAATTTRGRIIVIDTRTGRRAVWRNAAPGTGGARFDLLNLSFGLDGHELVFGGDTTCGSGPNPPRCQPYDQQVRLLNPAESGGVLSDGRLILRRILHGHTYITDAILSDDGSTLTVLNQLIPPKAGGPREHK
jgi:hypothetical protein